MRSNWSPCFFKMWGSMNVELLCFCEKVCVGAVKRTGMNKWREYSQHSGSDTNQQFVTKKQTEIQGDSDWLEQLVWSDLFWRSETRAKCWHLHPNCRVSQWARISIAVLKMKMNASPTMQDGPTCPVEKNCHSLRYECFLLNADRELLCNKYLIIWIVGTCVQNGQCKRPLRASRLVHELLLGWMYPLCPLLPAPTPLGNFRGAHWSVVESFNRYHCGSHPWKMAWNNAGGKNFQKLWTETG